MVSRILVRLGDDPCWRVRYTEVQDFACGDEMVQIVHNLFDAGGEVPPMQVEDVDVRRPQFLQRGLDADVERLCRVTVIRGLLRDAVVAGFPIRRILYGRSQQKLTEK